VLANRGFDGSLQAALGRPNASLWLAFGATAAVLAVLSVWPAARVFLGIEPVARVMVGACIAGAVALLAVLQLAKGLRGPR
jgi:predicted membrane metal-binding protein